MLIGEKVGSYTLVQKASFGGKELWVFMDGDKAVEWNPANGLPTEETLS